MTVQTKAERLADTLDVEVFVTMEDLKEAAAELRRLEAVNKEMLDEVARLQKREWVGLTIEERNRIDRRYSFVDDVIRATETKLRSKNYD